MLVVLSVVRHSKTTEILKDDIIQCMTQAHLKRKNSECSQ